MIDQHQEFWVFAYGSLMWRPGFEFIQQKVAQLEGFHRSFCVFSHVHRGTPDKPGLVLGLDEGGSCTGMAFSVSPKNWQETIHYLRAREQVTAVYLENIKQITLIDAPEKPIKAVTFLVDRNHQQYAGRISAKEQLKFILQGQGQSGNCRDYVIASAHQLADMGVKDDHIQQLAKTLSTA